MFCGELGAFPGSWIIDHTSNQLLQGLGAIVGLVGMMFFMVTMLCLLLLFLDLGLLIIGVKVNWERVAKKMEV